MNSLYDQEAEDLFNSLVSNGTHSVPLDTSFVSNISVSGGSSTELPSSHNHLFNIFLVFLILIVTFLAIWTTIQILAKSKKVRVDGSRSSEQGGVRSRNQDVNHV